MAKKPKKRQAAPLVENVPRRYTAPAVPDAPSTPSHGSFFDRDNVENLLIAILLALMFRAFEAEAFVIPTGSMAPTLMGRHKDLRCDECGAHFQTGESDASDSGNWFQSPPSSIAHVICPMCGFPNDTSEQKRRNKAVTGDRILVNKFAYQYNDPERWDVIVFKYPGNRKQSYIKRLVGLPGETIKIENGDVFVGPDEQSLSIARKPPDKVPYLLQRVHDTKYQSPAMIKAGWPSFWFDPSTDESDESHWQVGDEQDHFQLAADDGRTHWLRYRHVMPRGNSWQQIRRQNGTIDASQVRPGLITDFYAYNAALAAHQPYYFGWQNWVGDLALEADVQIRSDTGTLNLDLVEGGRHYRCDIDVATGVATLTIDNGDSPFDVMEPLTDAPKELTGQTSVVGRGPFRIRYANIDDQLLLWVDEKLVPFTASGHEHPGTYPSPSSVQPHWSPEDSGDLFPVGIGGTNIVMSVHRLIVLRDIYYISPKGDPSGQIHDYAESTTPDEVAQTMLMPETWDRTTIFKDRSSSVYQLGEDQFFPMGDNSPASKDARIWSELVHTPKGYEPLDVEHYVPRELLIGKAFLVYWPHGLDLGPIPLRIVPNVTRMKWIR